MIAVICPCSLSGHQDQQGASSGKCSTAILDTIQHNTDRKNMETDPTELQLPGSRMLKPLSVCYLYWCTVLELSPAIRLCNISAFSCRGSQAVARYRARLSALDSLGPRFTPFAAQLGLNFATWLWAECDTCLNSWDFRLLFLTFKYLFQFQSFSDFFQHCAFCKPSRWICQLPSLCLDNLWRLSKLKRALIWVQGVLYSAFSVF